MYANHPHFYQIVLFLQRRVAITIESNRGMGQIIPILKKMNKCIIAFPLLLGMYYIMGSRKQNVPKTNLYFICNAV